MGRSSGTARPRSIATIVAAACLTASFAGCGQSTKSHDEISLLPATVAKGESWRWTATCPYGPHAAAGCAPAGPELGPSQLAGNEWNLGAGHGADESVKMSLSQTGALSLNANLTSAPPCTAGTCLTREANTWVRGYPSVLYGIDQCHGKTAPQQSPDLALPARVNAIPEDLVGSATYDARGGEVTYDVAYDMWLSASDTKTPCQSDGTLEVMIWTDYNAKALLPDSLKVGTANVPFAVNGVFNSGDQAWSVYVNNVHGQGHTVPWGGTVWLVLNDANKTSRGKVTVDLSAALTTVGSLLEHNYGWSSFASNYWLDTIAFGMEFGPANADPYGNGPTRFSMDLSRYCLEVGTTAADASC